MSNEALTVLIIEDSSLFRSIALQALSGHKNFTATSVAEGLKIFQREKPDITFLDINLPDGSGLDLIKTLKEENPNAYVIMMTASDKASDVKAAADSGASSYIIKPFTPQRVHDHVSQYIDSKEAQP